MKYCLGVGLHNLYFDIAIVNQNNKIMKSCRCFYDRSRDISSNIYKAYKKHFDKYAIEAVGVGISNNIEFKDEVIYSIKAFSFNRYNLKQALVKQFKTEVLIIEETYAASLGVYYDSPKQSLLYVILDNKISNSFVVDGDIILLENDIDLSKNEMLNEKCAKDTLKKQFLMQDLDDEYIGGYFLSKKSNVRSIIKDWAICLNKELEKIVKILKVDKIVFAGYIGAYLETFKEYMGVTNRIETASIDSHKLQTLIGISHLIFKDK